MKPWWETAAPAAPVAAGLELTRTKSAVERDTSAKAHVAAAVFTSSAATMNAELQATQREITELLDPLDPTAVLSPPAEPPAAGAEPPHLAPWMPVR